MDINPLTLNAEDIVSVGWIINVNYTFNVEKIKSKILIWYE